MGSAYLLLPAPSRWVKMARRELQPSSLGTVICNLKGLKLLSLKNKEKHHACLKHVSFPKLIWGNAVMYHQLLI